MDECPECRALAVEPGWYKAMRDEQVLRAPFEILVPDADEPELVVMAEIPAPPDAEVPDLEPADRDE